MKKIYGGIISLICLCSLVVNAVLIQSWVSYKHQTQYVEASAMEAVSNDVKQASEWMPTQRTAAISRLTEAGGVLSTLYSVVPASSEPTRLYLFNVGYYLHFQGTTTPTNWLSQFMKNANKILQNHMSKDRYNIAYFSSDVAKLNDMLPTSFR